MQWCLVGMPGFLMAFLSLGARTYRDGFEYRCYSATQNRDVEAYIEPLRQVQRLPKRIPTVQDFQTIHAVADLWLKEYREGRLRPIPPAFADEEMPRGAREQIMNGRSALVATLKSASVSASKQGLRAEPVSLLLKAYEILEITKTSDGFLMGLSARSQWTTVAHLARELSKMSPKERKRWLPEIDRHLAATRQASLKAREFEERLKQSPEATQFVGGVEIRDLHTLLAYRSKNLSMLTSRGRTGSVLEAQGVVAVQAQREQEAALRLVRQAVAEGTTLPKLMADPPKDPPAPAGADARMRPGYGVPPWAYPAWRERMRWMRPPMPPAPGTPVTGSRGPQSVASLQPVPSP